MYLPKLKVVSTYWLVEMSFTNFERCNLLICLNIQVPKLREVGHPPHNINMNKEEAYNLILNLRPDLKPEK